MKKIICLGVMLVMFLGIISGCKGGWDPDYSCVVAYVKKDYYEKFNAKEFTFEDFGLNNIESFSCFYYFEDDDIYGRDKIENNKYFLLKLKKTGKKYAKQAIEHLNKLDFIEHAVFYNRSAGPGTEF